MVGNNLTKRLGAEIGDRLYFENRWWKVAGILDESGTIFDQEIWVDLSRLKKAAARDEYSCYTVKVDNPNNASKLINSINDDQNNLWITAMSAQQYYSESGTLFKIMGLIGVIIAITILTGSVLSGMTTMYAAVSGRTREIGTLKALGFTRLSLLVSFISESLMLALTGGVIGALLSFGLNGLALNFPMMSAKFSITWSSFAQGVILSLVVGLLGGLLPALMATKVTTAEAVKSI